MFQGHAALTTSRTGGARVNLYAWRMKEFTTRTEPIRFRIDKDEFEAAPDIPAKVLYELAETRSQLKAEASRDERFAALVGIFKSLLTAASFEVFESRLSSTEHPIPMPTLNEVMEWLLGEAYGLRPTQPSPSSTEQSAANGGPTSTDGAQPAEQTQEVSPGTVS